MTFNDMVVQVRANNNSLVKSRVDLFKSRTDITALVGKIRCLIEQETGYKFGGDKVLSDECYSRMLDTMKNSYVRYGGMSEKDALAKANGCTVGTMIDIANHPGLSGNLFTSIFDNMPVFESIISRVFLEFGIMDDELASDIARDFCCGIQPDNTIVVE